MVGTVDRPTPTEPPKDGHGRVWTGHGTVKALASGRVLLLGGLVSSTSPSQSAAGPGAEPLHLRTPPGARGGTAVPEDKAGPAALVITLAVAFGWHWAVHSRAQRDLRGAKAGLEGAKRNARNAAVAFGVVVTIVVVAVKVWFNKNGA